MKHWVVIMAAVCGLATATRAQQGGTAWEFNTNLGYAMPNDMRYIKDVILTYGIDAAWFSRPMGDEYWQLKRRFPAFGVKASYAAIPKGVYGDRFALTGLLRCPLGKHLEWTLGAGLSFYTKPYSLTHDDDNGYIGSLVNCMVDLALTCRPTTHTMLSLRFLHSSNGMLYYPNQGLNFIQLDLGYALSRAKVPDVGPVAKPEGFRRNEFVVAVAPGIITPRERWLSRNYYPTYNLTLGYQHYHTPTFAYGGCVDVWYNFAHQAVMEREGNTDYTVPAYVSVMPIMESFYGPLSIRAGMGLTVVASEKVRLPLYERVGIYYNFGRAFAGIGINAHGGQIEYVEWTLGLRL